MNDLQWCIDYLKAINHIEKANIPYEESSLRNLMNITKPINLSDEYYRRQGRVLQDILSRKTIIDVSSFQEGISLHQGDITLIKADAIVNACNPQMLGCFVPGHHCIDNVIHSYAGLEVRRDMMEMMERQGHDEPNGQVKVSRAYNLPSTYIFHTVGPVYSGSRQDEIDLSGCYLSCLAKADEMHLSSIVFCSLSTGVYGYPIEKACRTALNTVKGYLETSNQNIKKVLFDVFSNHDYQVYQETLKELQL